MKTRLLFSVSILVVAAALTLSLLAFAQSAQNAKNGGWVFLEFSKPPGDDQPAVPLTLQDKTGSRPAPRHSIAGMWWAPGGVQSDGVGAMPNDGKPQHQVPYTAYG